MSSEAAANVLPPAPANICFNKDEFIKADYDIDKFLADARCHASLETLREDLSVYMKILQSALVELINRDYADFVNLSSNLVGMDKIISNIKDPLNTFRGQVEGLRMLIDNSKKNIQYKLAQRAAIREKKELSAHRIFAKFATTPTRRKFSASENLTERIVIETAPWSFPYLNKSCFLFVYTEWR